MVRPNGPGSRREISLVHAPKIAQSVVYFWVPVRATPKSTRNDAANHAKRLKCEPTEKTAEIAKEVVERLLTQTMRFLTGLVLQPCVGLDVVVRWVNHGSHLRTRQQPTGPCVSHVQPPQAPVQSQPI